MWFYFVEYKKKSDKKKKKKRSNSEKEDKATRRRNSSSSSSRDGSHHSATKQQEQPSEQGKIVSASVDFIIPGRLELPLSNTTQRSTGMYTERHRRPLLFSSTSSLHYVFPLPVAQALWRD